MAFADKTEKCLKVEAVLSQLQIPKCNFFSFEFLNLWALFPWAFPRFTSIPKWLSGFIVGTYILVFLKMQKLSKLYQILLCELHMWKISE